MRNGITPVRIGVTKYEECPAHLILGAQGGIWIFLVNVKTYKGCGYIHRLGQVFFKWSIFNWKNVSMGLHPLDNGEGGRWIEPKFLEWEDFAIERGYMAPKPGDLVA